MQKKLLVFLVLLLILPVACMARDFDGFRADVPPGWEVMEEKGAMVGFVSPDREAIVTVTVASAQDVDPAAFAAEMARGLGGSDIMEEDGVYSFAFGDNGVTVVHVAGTDLTSCPGRADRQYRVALISGRGSSLAGSHPLQGRSWYARSGRSKGSQVRGRS